jgi:hypothetical protein
MCNLRNPAEDPQQLGKQSYRVYGNNSFGSNLLQRESDSELSPLKELNTFDWLELLLIAKGSS